MKESKGGADWQPSVSIDGLKCRARLMNSIRCFFQERDVLEVETPVLSSAATTDPNIESFSTCFIGPGAAQGQPCFLNTSPEHFMKRLLAAQSGPIFQICKAFRQGELGRLHNPEFTLLEWYRPGFSLHQLIVEVEQLVKELLLPYASLSSTEIHCYRDIFIQHTSIDPFDANIHLLQSYVKDRAIDVEGLYYNDRVAWIDLIWSHWVQPNLGARGLAFVRDYPTTHSALAQIRSGNPDVAERFELFYHGVELANGFYELRDAKEQQRRFANELAMRETQGLQAVPMDEKLLEALKSGLPDCSGVALGIDRLLMFVMKENTIKNVLAFPAKHG